MQIYLMRHGQAIPVSLWGGRDNKRPLSEVGFAQLHEAMPFIEKSDMNVGTIYTSPFERAHDTARLMATAFEGVKLIVEPTLAAGATASDFRNILLTSTERQNFLFIGHNPDLSVFASKCTGIANFMDDFSLNTGEIMLIEPGPIDNKWMKGKFIWRKEIQDWKKQL